MPSTLEKFARKALQLKGASAPFSMQTLMKIELIILGHVFGALSLEKAKGLIEKNGGAWTNDLNTEMWLCSDMHYGLKIPMYLMACQGGFRLATARRFSVKQEDMPLLKRALEYPALVAHLEELALKYAPLTEDKFKSEFSRAVRENSVNTERYVWRKLRFLHNSGMLHDDLVQDCVDRTYESMLRLYPKYENRTHFHNIYKLFIRQAGNKIIAHNTTSSRNYFDENGEMRVVHLDYEVGDTNSYLLMESGIELSTGINGTTEEGNDFLNLKMLYYSERLTPQDRKFLDLVSGETSNQFDSWVVASQGRTPAWFLTRKPDEYLKLVMQFLDYRPERLQYVKDLVAGKRQPVRPDFFRTMDACRV